MVPLSSYDRYSQDHILPQNSDAVFKAGRECDYPSELLLDYVYGCSAVKNWGVDTGEMLSFKNRPGLQQPASMAEKIEAGHEAKKVTPDDRYMRRLARSSGPDFVEPWEDTFVLNNWMQSPEAVARRAQVKSSFDTSIANWREGVEKS